MYNFDFFHTLLPKNKVPIISLLVLPFDYLQKEALLCQSPLQIHIEYSQVLTQDNSGPSIARNNGIKNARGEFIALNDSDDKWMQGKLKYQLDFLKNNADISLVTAKYVV